MRESGCSHVALETSSHALALGRVATIEFRAAVYTRITSEHLELHGTREQYLEAKSRLLALVGARRGGIAVLDRDDPFGFPRLTRLPVDRSLTYSAEGNQAADAVARDIASDPGGLRLTVATPWGTSTLRLQLPGRFNAANALAALCAACATGSPFESALAGLEELDRVRGRMERIDAGQPFTVVIDYAHTEEALDEVLQELRPITHGRIWTVFGSAGERDRDKRPAMGRVAARRSDRIVLTDEDPREEDRLAILEEIAAGAASTGGVIGENVFLIPDRAEAIQYAISAASPGDTVLLAGKGHESSLITSSGPAPWDERAAAESALRERGFSPS
jgi:UDP-N-acetylmuramoyl-L-alanyl-D-glutamate--2,6-diaminopimelate ligase